MIDSGDDLSKLLCERLETIGVVPIRAADLGEAAERVEEPLRGVTLVMVPVSVAAERIARSLKGLSTSAADGLTYLSYGQEPDRKWRRRLRAAGVSLALWEPYDESLLRFQVDRALGNARALNGRYAPRVPTKLSARVASGDRSKNAVVCGLSVNGAYLKTARPHMEGALIEIEFQLPENLLKLSAQVRFANVPGNLERRTLPRGMGVRFLDVPPATRKLLHSYISARHRQLLV